MVLNLKNIKLLYRKKEINRFEKLQKKINYLMLQTETTELWLKDDITGIEDDYSNVLTALEDICKEFYKTSIVKSFKKE